MPLTIPNYILRALSISTAHASLGYRSPNAFVVALNWGRDFGQRSFPCNRQKVPMISDMLNAASCEALQLFKWQRQFQNPAWGMVTGDLVEVIDIDGVEGFRQFEEFKKQYGDPGQTVTVESPREDGGRHLLYRVPEGAAPVRSTKLMRQFNKIDVKAGGGFVVGCGSLHKTGRRYAYMAGHAPDEIGMAVLPSEMREQLPKQVLSEGPSVRVARHYSGGQRVKRDHDPASLQIGDGPNYGGYENPIYKNAIRYFTQAGVDAPAATILRTLREIITAAPRDPGRSIERYISGEHLERTVERARNYVVKVQNDAR